MHYLQSRTAVGQRGPTDHTIRDQILIAADDHFSRYGYGKTTVAELAKTIGFSKAYIYKFFDSKQAIGDAICSACLGTITTSVHASLLEGKSATDKLRRLFKVVTSMMSDIAFGERKIYEIAAYASAENWPSAIAYLDELGATLTAILREGRQSGEFERKTPIDETVRAILLVYQPYINPVMLQHTLDSVPEGANEVVSLVLRSLAP